MMNAKEELLRALKGKFPVKCASITKGDDYWDDEDKLFIDLKLNYSDEEFKTFLKNLDFDYDNGFGGQILFGTVWFKDNTWLSREEYDGSEWWMHNKLPTIPVRCLN